MHRLVGAKQPVHSFLGGKGLGNPTRNECMGWFAQYAPVGQEFQPKTRLLEVSVGTADRMEIAKITNAPTWSSPEAKFLGRGLEVAQETWAPENSPSKKCCHVIFSFIFEVLHRGSLDCGVNTNWWRTHFVASYCFAPLVKKFLTNALPRCSPNWPFVSHA